MKARVGRPLRIGYLCSDVDIALFGNEGCSVKIREFTDALVEAGHDVFIVCSWLGDGIERDTKARVYHIEPKGLDGVIWKHLERETLVENDQLERDLRSIMINLWLKQEVASLFRREAPDLLYECYSLFGYGGVDIARQLGIPLVLEINAPLCQEQAGYEKFPFTRTAEAMEPEIFGRADVVVGVSEWMRRFAVSRGARPERTHALPNGVGRHFCEPASGDAVRARYGLVGKRVIGHVSSFHWWHDVDGLITAFQALRAGDPELRLLLVGHGPRREQAEKTVQRLGLQSDVIFTGHVPHKEVPAFIAALDVAAAVFVPQLGNELYGSPMKLFEYMAVGTPTVATAIGQISELIEDRQTAWLCRPGDLNDLRDGLAKLLYTPDLARRIGQAGREKALSEYTWRAISAKILSLAEPFLRPGPPAALGASGARN
jgi:glycosyltransferase involved in cell wall biosynthesis